MAREVELPVDLGVQPRVDEALHVVLDESDVTSRFGIGVDFEPPQMAAERCFGITDRLTEDVAEGMRRVGGHEKTPAATVGDRESDRGGDRGLAHAALAADEDDAMVEKGVQQHLKPSRGECSIPMRMCHSWNCSNRSGCSSRV